MGNIPLSSPPVMHVRRQLKRILGVVPVWRFLKGIIAGTPYYLIRTLGYVFYPVAGARAPLRGYHSSTLEFVRRGQGYFIPITLPSMPSDVATADAVSPELFVAVIPDGRIFSRNGAVIASDHRLLADVSWEGYDTASQPRSHPVMRKVGLPAVERVRGSIAVINSVQADNYYHWMFDVLPRLGILQQSGLAPDKYLVSTTSKFQMDTLKLLGVASDRILNPSADCHIEADELIIPSLSGPAFVMSPQSHAYAYLRSSFLRSSSSTRPHRAIYVSRADAGNRRVINETEICEEVTSFGFEVVTLGNLSFSEQIKLFAEARIIVGPHGAGFTNAVFCQAGTVLIEFLPDRWRVDCFERMARFGRITYHSLICQEGETARGIVTYDHVVDRLALRELLRRYAPLSTGLKKS